MPVLERQRYSILNRRRTSTKNVNDFRADVNDPANTGGPMSTTMSTARQRGPLTSYVSPVGAYVNDGPTVKTSTARNQALAGEGHGVTTTGSRAATWL